MELCVEVRELLPFLAPSSNGLQGAVAQYAVNQTRNTEADLFSCALHNTRVQLLYVPYEGSSNNDQVSRLGLEPTLC